MIYIIKYKILIFNILFCLPVLLSSQNETVIDSLSSRLGNSQSKYQKNNSYNEFTIIPKGIDTIKAKEFAINGFLLSQDFELESKEISTLIDSSRGFINVGDYAKADSILNSALDICLVSCSENDFAIVYNFLGLKECLKGDFQNGIYLFKKGLGFVNKDLKSPIAVSIHNNLSSGYLLELNQKNSVISQLRKNTQLKVDEISNSLKQEKEKSAKIRMYTILIGSIIFFLFLSATFLAYLYRQKKRIAEYKIDEILSKNERNTNYARLEEQESERNRIATDLHDRLGAMFTAIKFSMGDVEATLSDINTENKVQYDKVNNLIDQACDEVRNIAHDLRNSTLANFGLKVALESLIDSLTSSNIQIELLTHGLEDYRMSNKIEINIYLIIQELISNALKHSKAKKMTIQLNRFENRLNISVEDNGIGFDRERVKLGMGIYNIESRVVNMEGQLNIDSNKGNGTTVMIDIPLNIIN